MKAIEIKFNLSDNEYMTALRLAVGAVCALAEADVDGTEDMKVCVTEGCLILQGCGYESARITLNAEGGFTALVTGEGGAPKAFDNGFSLALISALVADFGIEEKDGVINKLSLKL